MSQLLQGAVLGRAVSFAVWLVFCAQAAYGQQLSIRHYDVRDGLAHSRVMAIHQDRKGYLWFGTWEGLSRFDGYRYTNYDTRDGLGTSLINGIIEDRKGRLWVATNGGGVSRLIDHPQQSMTSSQRPGASGKPMEKEPAAARPKFVSFPVGPSPESNRVNALLFDSGNNCWCATDDGLYRGSLDQTGNVAFALVIPHQPVAEIMTAFADSKGRLWFGILDQLIEIVHGQIIKYGPADDVGYPVITSLIEDLQGRVLLADAHGIFELVEPKDSETRGRWKRLPVVLAPGQIPYQMLVDSHGALWIATAKGLIKYKDGQTLYTTAHGLSDDLVRCLDEDRDGNLWMGTWSGGVCKLSGEMIVSFTRAEGLPDQHVVKVLEDHQRRIYASTIERGLVEIVEGKAVAVRGSQKPPFDNIGRRILQDRNGDWWVGTEQGLFQFQGPELQLHHGKKFTTGDGISDMAISNLYQDPTGKVWISAGERNLYFFDPARAGRALFGRIPLETIKPPHTIGWMASDRAGTLWVGAQFGLLARLRNGIVSPLRPTNGLPDVDPRALFLDSRGWLWIGLRSSGVSITKDATAEHPEFVNYSTESGLSSDFVLSIAEDDSGRIYLGTFKGLDRLDPFTEEIRHFTTTDGLAANVINHCMTDSRGNIWIATSAGLSKLDPHAEHVVKNPPAIYLSRVQVAGEDLPLEETGAARMSAPELSASRNNLVIEYVGLSFQGEGELRYRYQLEGSDTDWSLPTEQRSVNYARLAAGSYRFMVRAITRQGIASEPAVFEFRILPPIWQRWWFLTVAAVLIGLAIYAAYRYRVARLIEVERVRMRIATDLHDDIGSSLSRMAILSEVVKRQIHGASQESVPLLTEIADTARGLVDGMSDIVWSIDPRRDDLSNLVYRIRQFASDVLEPKGIAWDFQIPSDPGRVKLTPEQRRHIYLIFKEAINNIVRHAECESVALNFDVADHQVVADVRDDGQGFTNLSGEEGGGADARGHGLQNMRMRAEQLGGHIRIDSVAGQGTHIKLVVPLRRHLT
jgi:ligand-binding sensor domain-containing protein/signal transduction histidine kinase